MPVDIVLSSSDLEKAEQEANRRQKLNESLNLEGRNKAPKKGEKALKMHLLGCIGEIAVAEYLGLQDHLFVNKMAIRGSADLPGNIEVKTRGKHGYDLLVQLSDSPSKIFVLATYEQGAIAKIVGWITGDNAIQKGVVRELVSGRKCLVVPWQKLNPVETLAPFLSGDFNPRYQEFSEVKIDETLDRCALFTSLLSRLGVEDGDTLRCSFLEESPWLILEKK